ncbi:hypothetical protein H8S90_04565 [Olivibacter sp. SDN3]|uniref:porin n=1 Tax=Olivibacter sp. SDN3 TaxID=2764720 RepID=UPI0016511861|nr:porin [Olivibacter sp. SDN3]QNL50869.1 hypothetical protein H8S90_04565 [Olivibacter sp. SDN3]
MRSTAYHFIILPCVLVALTFKGFAATTDTAKVKNANETAQLGMDTVSAKQAATDKRFFMNALLRTAFHGDSFFNEGGQNSIGLDEARIDIGGNYNDRLSYRVRYRLNRAFAETGQDNGSQALDWAYLHYKFGNQNKWSVTAGKQSALVGSYEFQNNPIYELLFTDYVDRILNLFVVGGTLSHQVDKNHSLNVQIYNTTNEGFDRLFQTRGYNQEDLNAASNPLGTYFTWIGAFADQKIHTKWSYNISQFAKGHTNHNISLANKLALNKTLVYLDLQYSYLPVDYTMVVNPVLNTHYGRSGTDQVLARGIQYKTAVLRLDQMLTDHWEISLKGAYETASSRKDEAIGKDFRKNYTYTAALQYKPYESQDLRFYLAYIGNTIDYSQVINASKAELNRVSLGLFYTIPVF